jgi:hypothetical protein
VSSTTRHSDGRHDFDFLLGRWHVANRKLEDPLADDPTAWLEFAATTETRPILDGLGNVDDYRAPDFPGRPGFHGFALRLFDPGERLWRIWWASTSGGGRLDTPLVGGFRDGVGQFECDDTIDGRAVRMHFDWKDITPSSARWVQSFSFDGGRSFEPNWIMEFSALRAEDHRGPQREHPDEHE